MQKKGQGEQFNWILVIVAGAIILGFFTMFTFKYVELQKKRQNIETIKFLGDGILAASSRLQVGSGGASIDAQENSGVRFGYNVGFTYSCNGNDADIFVENSGFSYRLQDEVVFMDKNLRFGSLDGVDLWILPWNFPYYTTNFIYLANSKTKFYLVYDSSSEELVNGLEISSVFDQEIINIDKLDEIRQNSKVVFFTQKEPGLNEINNLIQKTKNVDFIYVNNNEARFFSDGKWGKGVRFYGLEQLYGAVFSDDANIFECNINRAFDKTRNLALLYVEKARILNQLDRREGCKYGQTANALSHFASGNFDLEKELEELNLGGGCIWVF